MEIQAEGWWEQDYFGRQAMNPLVLNFDNGNVTGSGNDIVGPFTMSGVIKDGNVAIKKRYVGQHDTDYIGQFDGEGTMQGKWHIHEMTGPWMIHLRGPREGGADQDARDIQQL
ncbi:MAG: hypothetical protein WBD20_02480 [Pirellulaceae bacterium]